MITKQQQFAIQMQKAERFNAFLDWYRGHVKSSIPITDDQFFRILENQPVC